MWYAMETNVWRASSATLCWVTSSDNVTPRRFIFLRTGRMRGEARMNAASGAVRRNFGQRRPPFHRSSISMDRPDEPPVHENDG